MSLGLQCEMARNIFNTQFLQVIGGEDPIIVKLIKKAHEFGIETNRRHHNMEKTTKANLVRGEIGKTWFKQRQHCKNFVGNCGVCLRFKGIKAQPPLGPSLVRVANSIKLFQHVALDPLGHIRVMTHGSSRQKMYQLIMVDIDRQTAVQIQHQSQAGLFRWGNTIDLFSFREEKQFLSAEAGQSLGNIQQLSYCQFRNVCERKVAMAKRMVRQMLFGLPGHACQLQPVC